MFGTDLKDRKIKNADNETHKLNFFKIPQYIKTSFFFVPFES